MNIAVIAANGRLGRAFISEALAAGHVITAGVRGDNTFRPHENLTVVKCDATNAHAIQGLIHGQDAVVSTIGHVKHSPKSVQTEATHVVVEAMKQASICRFVTVTGTGVRFAGDHITFLDRILNAGIAMIDPARIKDGREHVKVLQQSTLAWTVIRVLKLQNSAAKPFKLMLHGPTKLYVGRKEVAQAMLEVLQEHSFINEAPIISHR